MWQIDALLHLEESHLIQSFPKSVHFGLLYEVREWKLERFGDQVDSILSNKALDPLLYDSLFHPERIAYLVYLIPVEVFQNSFVSGAFIGVYVNDIDTIQTFKHLINLPFTEFGNRIEFVQTDFNFRSLNLKSHPSSVFGDQVCNSVDGHPFAPQV